MRSNLKYNKSVLRGILYAVLLVALCVAVAFNISYMDSKKPALNGGLLIINEVSPNNMSTAADEDGDYPDWIELYNGESFAIDLSGFGLSDDSNELYKFTFPDTTLASGEYMLIYASGKDRQGKSLHTAFKLDAGGETLVLSDTQGNIVDKLTIPSVSPDVSYGRIYSRKNRYAQFSTGTPIAKNDSAVLRSVVAVGKTSLPVFSKESGCYDSEFNLSLSVDDSDTVIFYTLDSTQPDLSSHIYTEPIKITDRSEAQNRYWDERCSPLYSYTGVKINDDKYCKGTVVRARSYKNGVLSDETVTKTYFVSQDFSLPVVSVVSDPENFFGFNDGIYVLGKSYYEWRRDNLTADTFGFVPANYKTGRLVNSHVEMIGKDGQIVFSQNAGVGISGNWTRTFACKSLRIVAGSEYDEKESFDGEIFSDPVTAVDGSQVTSFKSLILRSSGNDFNKTMIRDALMQTLVSDIGLMSQAYTPCLLFIDGEYWGIHNIREKISKQYFVSRYGIDETDLALISTENELLEIGKESDLNDFIALVDFAKNHDLSVDENYDHVARALDIDNTLDYFITEIYIANADWTDANCRVWRSKMATDGKWRFLLYDTDQSFDKADTDTFGLVMSYDANHFSLFAALMQNEGFKKQFNDRVMLYMNTIFLPETVIGQIDDMASVISHEIPEHKSRWFFESTALRKVILLLRGEQDDRDFVAQWNSDIEVLRSFAKSRPEYMLSICQ